MPEQRQPGADRLKKLALMFFSLLLSLAIVETAARVRQYVKYGSGRMTLYATTVDPASGLPIPTPNQVAGPIRINSLGFRSPELVVPKPPGTIRLAFLGSSTTFCAEVSSSEAAWPDLVWKELQSHWPDAQFDYLNAGVPGYTVADSLLNLRHRVARLQPDVIVIYEATNDLSLDTRELAAQQGLLKGKPEDPSWVARHSLAWFLAEKNLEILFRQKRAASETRHLVFNPRELSRGFHDQLLRLVEASKETAPLVAVVTFSHRARRSQSHEEQVRACISSFYYMPYMSVEGLLAGFEEYNRAIREVAQQSRAILVAGEDTIPGTGEYFHDSVHFTDAGSKLMAGRVAQALLQSPEFQRLMGARLHGTKESKSLTQNPGPIQEPPAKFHRPPGAR